MTVQRKIFCADNTIWVTSIKVIYKNSLRTKKISIRKSYV
nr:MAG TPA: hypothetical protein [Bacteriophage sp.]